MKYVRSISYVSFSWYFLMVCVVILSISSCFVTYSPRSPSSGTQGFPCSQLRNTSFSDWNLTRLWIRIHWQALHTLCKRSQVSGLPYCGTARYLNGHISLYIAFWWADCELVSSIRYVTTSLCLAIIESIEFCLKSVVKESTEGVYKEALLSVNYDLYFESIR